MIHTRRAQFFLATIVASSLAFVPRPDVKVSSTTQLEFKGALGTMMRLMGAGKPMQQIDYTRGNLKRTDTIDKKGNVTHSTIIDLDRELFIHIDHNKKKYSQMSFAEWRERLQKGIQSLSEKSEKGKEQKEQAPEVKWSFDVKVDKTGEKATIAGYPAEKVILTLKLDAEATGDENNPNAGPQKGGLIVTSTNWLAKSVASSDEIMNFNNKLAEKMGLTASGGGMASVITALSKSNPQLAAAMEKLEAESKKLEGVPLRTASVFETWGEPQAAAQSENPDEPKTEMPSVGGLFKGIGKKVAKKKSDDTGDDNKNVLMESNSEVEAYTSDSLPADLFTVPANYKQEQPPKY